MSNGGYEECTTYDNSWHIIPPDYVHMDDEYRYTWVPKYLQLAFNIFQEAFFVNFNSTKVKIAH